MKQVEPKMGHWSMHLLCWLFVVLGIIIALGQIDIIEGFEPWTWLLGSYFMFAGVFLAIESLLEAGSFTMPRDMDIISLMIAIVAFLMGAITFTKYAVPVAWSGVYFLLSIIVAGAIALEFYTE